MTDEGVNATAKASAVPADGDSPGAPSAGSATAAAEPEGPGESAKPAIGEGALTSSDTSSERQERIFELIATAILAVATVAAAWSGYQATRWSGVQAADYVEASARRVDSTKADTRAGQNAIYDSQVFSQWLNAYNAGDTNLARVYEKRFLPEFVPAFRAWLATDPLHNPSAPPGPMTMPQFVSPDAQQADALEKQATAMFDSGQQANETSDNYVLNTVYLASALFLAGIAGRFTWRPSRIALLVVASIALGLGLFNILRLPIQ